MFMWLKVGNTSPKLLTLEQILIEGIVHNLKIMITWQMCCKLGGILNIFRNFLTSSLVLAQMGFQFFLGCYNSNKGKSCTLSCLGCIVSLIKLIFQSKFFPHYKLYPRLEFCYNMCTPIIVTPLNNSWTYENFLNLCNTKH